jgi:hypothetical protein
VIRAHTFALALAASMSALNASAQDSARAPTVILAPASPSRWDMAAHVTWLGERLNQSTGGNHFFGVGSGGADIGYYWTPHLKLELDVATSTKGEIYSYEQIPSLPGAPFSSFLQRDHEFRVTTAAAGLNAQFLENAWFHPFIGAGVELLREREHIESTVPVPIVFRDGRPVTIAPETRVRYAGRPFVAAGFKGYVSERVFIRTDLRTSWSTDGVAAVAWRTGVGVDF